MSRITKMKYVTAETKMDYELPTPKQTICTIIKVLGNSTYLVATPDGEEFIASMPAKFRRHVYVRRRSFVVIEPIPEGKKVKGEIVRILQRNQIKHFHQAGVWPEAFNSTVYIDNTFASQKKYRLTNESDRGVVHGDKYFFMDGENCRPVMRKKDQDDVDGDMPSLGELRLGVSSGIEPNYNKKAVTRMIFPDEEENDSESDDEEESDDCDEECDDDDDDEESDDDNEETDDDDEEENADENNEDEEESVNNEESGAEEARRRSELRDDENSGKNITVEDDGSKIHLTVKESRVKNVNKAIVLDKETTCDDNKGIDNNFR
ncbi:probable RNA-binding protein EIF1AD [Hyalella azteca]|uniref:Probable RNA-binding protein EIF1AD n=1 Tax=Hyalella azteca TaxID=294128 RepID=A0A8B7NVF0_HYAAZ|nr:probable RNA-binding protein EIF1AD [Hyalella azteca]XP_018017728.1 probable RNA-binding protein EIF1AD [Hyalella azteca]